jgi:hypothetical protein
VGCLRIVPEIEPTDSLAGRILHPIRFWVLNDMPVRRWKSAGCHHCRSRNLSRGPLCPVSDATKPMQDRFTSEPMR